MDLNKLKKDLARAIDEDQNDEVVFKNMVSKIRDEHEHFVLIDDVNDIHEFIEKCSNSNSAYVFKDINEAEKKLRRDLHEICDSEFEDCYNSELRELYKQYNVDLFDDLPSNVQKEARIIEMLTEYDKYEYNSKTFKCIILIDEFI